MKKIFIICLIIVASSSLYAQDDYTSYRWKDHWIPTWMEMRGSFLEPNRFAVAYDFKPSWLRLDAGYGSEFFRISTVAIGGEGLIWSGLKSTSDFRFPVETADYFFGIYTIFPLPLWGSNLKPWRMRFRVSHISSHLVDGADTITGGSSSRYSREFVSLETLFDETERSSFRLSLGVRYIFHQVQNIEQPFQFPAVLDFVAYNDQGNQLFATISSAAGPSLAAYSAGITFRHTTSWNSISDLYAEYHTGRTRYGAEGNIKQDGFEVGVRIGAAKDLETKK
jgi:hypothetical protein